MKNKPDLASLFGAEAKCLRPPRDTSVCILPSKASAYSYLNGYYTDGSGSEAS